MASSKRAPLHKNVSRLTWIVGIAAIVGFWLALQFIPLSPDSNRQALITVHQGDRIVSIAQTLSQHGLVRSKFAVYLAAVFTPRDQMQHLHPGEYEVSPSQTAQEILAEIASGRTATVSVIFPEGFTLSQIASRLQQRHVVDAAQFLDVARTEGYAFKASDGFTPPSANMEGYLFPDEYDFGPDSTVRSVIQQMLQRFDDRVVKTHPHVTDWSVPLTVASLIERETSVESERPMIASVIYNRLQIDMPLQIDASVQYALPEHKSRLMYSDLQVDSSYNTYKHRGLPPTPICSPGLPSIDAALNPSTTNYLFYVEGPGGRHMFGRTMAEQLHNIKIGNRGRSRID